MNGNQEKGHEVDQKSADDMQDSKLLSNHLISPYIAPDEILAEFPPTKLLSTNLDPLVDDSIEFGKKLRELKVQTSADVLKGLPHGFLYFGQLSKECYDATMVCLERIMDLLK